MSFRPDLGGIQRAGFILLLSGFLYVELAAIDKASDEQRGQFATLVAQAKASLERQEVLAKQTVNTITGGDSYCYLQFSADRYLMTFVRKGDEPLYDVNAVIMYQSDLRRVIEKHSPTYEEMEAIQHRITIGNFGPQTAIVLKNVLKFPTTEDGGFTIHFNGRNGFWNQYLLVHKTKSGWAYASRVTRQVIGSQETPIPGGDDVGAEFPKPVDWNKLR